MDAAARVLLRTLSSIPLGYLLIKKGVDCLRRKRNASFQLQAISGEAAGGKGSLAYPVKPRISPPD